MKLTAKQEKFAQLVAKGSDHSSAYREAYDTKNMKDETIWNNAYKLSNVNDVATRIDSLKEKTAKRNEVTLDEGIALIRKAAEIANGNSDASNLRGAAMDLLKAAGLLVDKKHVKGDINLRELLDELDED